MGALAAKALPGFSLAFAGSGYIAGQGAGVVTVAGVPASRKVFLLDRSSMRLVAVTTSAANGTYRFSALASRSYVVIALDGALQFNAVIRDNITPVADP